MSSWPEVLGNALGECVQLNPSRNVVDDSRQQAVMTLLIVQNQPHDLSDDCITAGLGEVLILVERAGLLADVSCDSLKQPIEREPGWVVRAEHIGTNSRDEVFQGDNSRDHLGHDAPFDVRTPPAST